MRHFDLNADPSGLLVSVRSADEALSALAGGANVIDVKEPSRGSLGAADREIVAAVVEVVGGRATISVAAGEILENSIRIEAVPGVAFLKIGLAGCRPVPDWVERWRAVLEPWPKSTRPVAVVYADWRDVDAPAPNDVLAAAIALGSPALLVDTWNKAHGALFDRWPAQDLALFCGHVRAAGIGVVLAGSLQGDGLQAAAALRPALVAVRGAACDGGRLGRISESRVRSTVATLRAAAAFPGDRLLSPTGRATAKVAASATETLRTAEFS